MSCKNKRKLSEDFDAGVKLEASVIENPSPKRKRYVTCRKSSSEDKTISGIAAQIIAFEKLEASLVSAYHQLGRALLYEGEVEHEKNIDVFRINSSTDNNSSNLGGYLLLQVVRGSVRTCIWNCYARQDDEYKLLYVESPDATSPATSVMLWHMQGIDWMNHRLQGFCIDWPALHKLRSILQLENIPLHEFTVALNKLLLNTPITTKFQRLKYPMPATLMSSYLLSLHCYPFTMPRSVSNECVIIDLLKETDDWLSKSGYNSPVLECYQPFYTTSKKRVLHNVICGLNKEPLFPLAGVPTSFNASFVRVVEIMQHNIGIYEMIAIVEHIQCNEHNAVRTRYVAVDVGALLLALKFQRNCSIEDIGANGNAPEIQIFDGKDWEEYLAAAKHLNVPEILFSDIDEDEYLNSFDSQDI